MVFGFLLSVRVVVDGEVGVVVECRFKCGDGSALSGTNEQKEGGEEDGPYLAHANQSPA
jgi:hypothetical protein